MSSTNIKPRAYQLREIKLWLKHAAHGTLAEPGLGKTFIALTALKVLKARGLCRRALVVCPLRPLYATWPAEVEKWLAGLTYTIAHDTSRADLDDLETTLAEVNRQAGGDGRLSLRRAATKDEALDLARAGKVDVVLINPDGLEWLSRQRDLKRLFDVLVVDESSKFKNPGTRRWKIMKGLLNHFKRRYVMTGSPASNGLLNLWGQVFLLDGGKALGKYYTHFKVQYFAPTGYMGYDWEPLDGAEREVYRAIKPLVTSLTNAEYGNLPALVEQDLVVRLPPKALAVYRDLEDEMIAALENGEVTAANAAARTQKLRQVANGAVYAVDTDGKRYVERLHDAKVEALVDLVDELEGQPLLVGYEFEHDLAALVKAFPRATVFSGRTKPGAAPAVAAAWTRGEIAVLLGQTSATAYGLNLQEGPGHHVAFFGLTWNQEHYDQFIRRVWRSGQRQRVFLHRVVAHRTVDEDLIASLGLKTKFQSALFTALKRRLLK